MTRSLRELWAELNALEKEIGRVRFQEVSAEAIGVGQIWIFRVAHCCMLAKYVATRLSCDAVGWQWMSLEWACCRTLI